MTTLETIIPPEIHGCEFAALLTECAARPDIKTILEIGSSTGEGSTAAIVKGMGMVPHEKVLFCVEMSEVRMAKLAQRYAGRHNIFPCFGSSVASGDYLTPYEVREFYEQKHTNLNNYPLDEVLQWLKQDLNACAACENQHVIETIRFTRDIHAFDMVLIDGSAFTGFAELQAVFGAKIIALDDIVDIKNMASFNYLLDNRDYRLLKTNPTLRNGYAVFERTT
jgi:hypothetical protein